MAARRGLVGGGGLGEPHELTYRFVDAFVQERQEQLWLALEVPVDRAAGEPSAVGDGLQRAGAVAVLGDFSFGGV